MMSLRRPLTALWLVASLATYPGCSLVVASRQTLTVAASDPKAEIYVDGQYVGTGSGAVSVRRDEDHAVIARAGERTGTASIGTKISGTGIADIVGCALILLPCFGLLGAGFWRLDPSNVAVNLPPKAAGEH